MNSAAGKRVVAEDREGKGAAIGTVAGERGERYLSTELCAGIA